MISTSEFRAIAELDLEPIKVKLMHKESGEGWTLEYANQMEFEYRRFLYLMKAFPNESVAPLVDVDVFWHYHILDTMKYAVDCDTVFGYFLHHYPYLGLGAEEDAGEHERVGDRMKELYEQSFGEPCVRDLPEGAHAGQVSDAQKPAWCFVETGHTAKAAGTAWCFVDGRMAAKLGGKTAWCFVDGSTTAAARPIAPGGKTAWCFVDGSRTTVGARPSARAGQIAWCFVDGGGTAAGARPLALTGQTAWCFVDGGTTANTTATANAGQTAWCFVDGGTTMAREVTQIKLGRRGRLQTGRPALAQA